MTGSTLIDTLPAFLAAALALMGSPGPVTIASAAAGAAWPGRAAAFVLAMSAGTITVILMVAAGITGLIASVPGAAPVLAGLGALYILYLAWRIASAAPIGTVETDRTPPPLIGAYAMAIANPKAWAAFAALFSGFPLVPEDPVAGGVLKAAILCSLPPLINLTWMIAGTGLARLIRDPATGRAVNVGFALLLVGAVALVLVV